MEYSPQTIPSKSSQPMASFAGDYRILETADRGEKREFKALPILVKVTQEPNFIGVELFNEDDGSISKLNYPVNGVGNWDSENKLYKFTRQVGKNYVVDLVNPPGLDVPTEWLTKRITWEKDDLGRIQENYEHFDAQGMRMNSSPGVSRILAPIVAS